MLPPTPHYEPSRDFLRQGDIGYFPFSQLLLPDEADRLPGAVPPPPAKGIPVFDGMTQTELSFDGETYILRRWHGFGIVIDITSELYNSPEDSRVTVAALVTSAAASVNWDQLVKGQIAGGLPLPQAARGSIAEAFPEQDWPDVVVAPRSVTTVSRGIVEAGRLMSLTPRMAILLAAKLSEMYGARTWSRMHHFDNVVGQTLGQVDDIGKSDAPPENGNWAVLTFDNGERMHVFVNPKTSGRRADAVHLRRAEELHRDDPPVR